MTSFKKAIAHHLRRLADAASPAPIADMERLNRFMDPGADTTRKPSPHGDDSAYWPDKHDPLAQTHGREKCEALERRLFAMTVVAWMAHAEHSAKLAAADVLGRRVPGFGDDFMAATQAAVDFTGVLKHHLRVEALKAQHEAASAPQGAGATEPTTATA